MLNYHEGSRFHNFIVVHRQNHPKFGSKIPKFRNENSAATRPAEPRSRRPRRSRAQATAARPEPLPKSRKVPPGGCGVLPRGGTF